MLTLFAFGLALFRSGDPAPPSPRWPALNTLAAVTTKYRMESNSETLVDLSGVGQPNQQTKIKLIGWLSLTVADTAGGRTVRLVVDSMRLEADTPMLTQASADSAKGGFLHGRIAPDGRVKDVSVHPDGNTLLVELQGMVYSFFPRVKAGARSGEAWTDSLEIPTISSVANLVNNYRMTYTAAGPESVAGIAGQRINVATSAKQTGTLENPMAGTMEVEGMVTGNGTFVIAADGRYLGGTSTFTTDQMIKISMAPSPIPVRSQRTMTVTVIP